MRFAHSKLGLLLVLGMFAALLPTGAASVAFAADPEPLFTQYVEGGGYNKAIEIGNVAGSDIAVDGYVLELYSNGSATVSQSVTLSGVIAAGDVFVVAHGSAAAEILGVADLESSSVANWNGDDAVVLRNASGDVVDSIGEVGFDPGSQWGDSALGTKDNTLCRFDSIVVGDTDPSDVFDPADEWTALGKDVFDGLGAIGCEPIEPPATEEKIYDVQGPGLSSPLEGQRVIVEGVVTSDQQDGDFNGWFMQEVAGDGIDETSDGIFIYEGGNTVEVNVGDVVKVEGTVVEFFGETQITDIDNVTVTGNASFDATEVTLPWVDADQPEWYEGMYVTIPQPLTISEYYNFDRYGEIVLTVGRPPTPTAVYDPGSTDQADLALANQLGRITLDDNRTSQNPDPAIHPNGEVFDLNNLFRGGDIVENVTGVVNYSYGKYRVQPTQGADYTAVNPRPAFPDDVGGDLTVASFNVLNYFTTIDTGESICGPDENLGCRGADSPDEFERQRTKIIAAISDISADVVGLIEIENYKAGGVDEPIADLVAGLNDTLGVATYSYVETGPIGDDAIKVAFIYKPATVSLNGGYAILDGSVDPRFNDDKNRPALAQTFTENVTGESVTVVVNHLKSKGSDCDSLGDPDLGDGAGNCNLTRTSAAEALVDWLAADATGTGEDDVLIIGDLNSYDKEDPIDAIVAGGYTDLVDYFMGELAYSYVFSGQWGYLDYALANESLQSAITGTTVWHINADEPDILDYNIDFKKPPQQALYEPNAFRASDHDPVIVGLNLANPQGDKGAVVGDLEALLPTGSRSTDRRINKAINLIEASLNPDWWTSDQTITNKRVFDNERSAVVQLELVAAGGPAAAAAQVAIDVLVNADRQLAQIELIAAVARDGRASKIAAAERAMAHADELTMAGRYNEAINAYKRAWDAAAKA